MKIFKSLVKIVIGVALVWGAAALLDSAVSAVGKMPAWTVVLLFGAGLFFSARAMLREGK